VHHDRAGTRRTLATHVSSAKVVVVIPTTTADEVHQVLDRLCDAGCRAWLAGGWGVDALAGRQTRPHRDLDLLVDEADEATTLAVLTALGYTVETDQRPTRVELGAPGRGRVDVHLLVPAGDGSAHLAGLLPEVRYPAASFTEGVIADRTVACVSIAQQLALHAGYPPREVDLHDLVILERLRDPGSPTDAPTDSGRGASSSRTSSGPGSAAASSGRL